MTYIEFFDKDACENICSCVINPPECVILIGNNKKLLEKHTERYSELFQSKGYDIEFQFRSVNKNQIQTILSILSEIVEEYNDCVFDLTGGDELYLTSVGILFERNRDKNIQMHRVNLQNGVITDCDCDGNTIESNTAMQFSIDEYIRLYGGKIVYESNKIEGTYSWNLDYEFLDDFFVMWSICKSDVRLWNAQISVFGDIWELFSEDENSLSVNAPIDILEKRIKNHGGLYIRVRGVINRLKKYGLMTFDEYDGMLRLSFKNNQVMRCLTAV